MSSPSLFLAACHRAPTTRTPIWLMRQAGRYMKEYRAVREKNSFLDLCKNSDLAAEVTVYAAKRLGVDAAIIFSDLLLILEPMGLKLEYTKGDGPVIRNPVRTLKDVETLRIAEAESLEYVYEAIRKTRRDLPEDLPLIGFAGAPFTLASYMIEGSGSRDYTKTLALMREEPAAWSMLMDKLLSGLSAYLKKQVKAGAQALQIFDSWVGCLSAEDYRRHVLPHTRRLLESISSLALPAPWSSDGIANNTVPIIHFGTNTSHLLEGMRDAGGDVIGLDWRIALDQGWARVGYDKAVMGNLDPQTLFQDVAAIRTQAQNILSQAGGRPGHIFNLGHGVLPETPVENVKALVEMVHEMSERQ